MPPKERWYEYYLKKVDGEIHNSMGVIKNSVTNCNQFLKASVDMTV